MMMGMIVVAVGGGPPPEVHEESSAKNSDAPSTEHSSEAKFEYAFDKRGHRYRVGPDGVRFFQRTSRPTYVDPDEWKIQ